jgi:ubiquinone/menaquinone biosynthesis C-methylase UbiE
MRARELQPELMDDPAIDPREHRRALEGLARLNRLSDAGGPLWRGVRTMLGSRRRGSLLDVATGSGDVLASISRRARGAGVELELLAADKSALALEQTAARLAERGQHARLLAGDVVEHGLALRDGEVDISVCSLFLHHLAEAGVVRVLAEMARVSKCGVVLTDLRRCRAGLVAAQVIPRCVTRSAVVHTDAVLSVRAAWTMEELANLASRAGMPGAIVQPSWPWRMRLTWSRPDASSRGGVHG